MSWDDLSMREKAAMMRVAVKNKIFEIDKIKEAYNNLDRLVSNSEVINPNLYTPSVNLNINPALDYVGNALESISGYEYEGNPLNKLGIDMSFDLGTTGSSMYPNGVRFVKKFEDGGDINFLNRILLGLSSFLMELGRSGNPKFKTEGTLGAAQDTYLLPRDVLDKFFKEAGYIEGTPGDYGLVSKAVGDRDIPVYLRAPDAVSRDDLAVIGNPKEGDYEIRNGLYHAGTHPTALYVGDDYKMYLKQWDLNDYGTSAGGAGASSHYNRGRKILSNLVDFIGSPVVVTSGFLPIISGISSDHHVTLMDLWEKNDPYALKYVKEQGLYPHYEEVLAEYLGVPTDLYVKLLVGFDSVPTIVVTPKGKYIYNSITGEEMPIDDYLDANGVSEKKYNGGKINRFNDGGPTSKNSEENVTIDYPPIVRKLASLVYIIDGNEIKFSPEEIMAMTNRKYDYASAINRKLSYMLYKYDLEHKGKYKHKHAIPTNFSTSITPLVKQENDEYYNSLSTEDLLKLLKEQKEINGIFEPLFLPKTISDGIHDAGKKVRQSAKVTSKQVKQIKEDAKKYEPMLKDSLESLLKLPEKIQEITEAAASENQEVRDDNFYMRNLFLDSTLTAFGIHGLLGNIANRWPQLAYRRVYNPHLPFSYTLVPTRLGLIAYFRPWNAARSMLAAIALDGIQAFLDPTEGGKTYNALEATSGLAGLIGFSDVLRGIPRIGPALDASFDILGVALNFKDATNLVTNFDSWAIDKLNNWLEDDLNNSNTK